MTYGARMKTQQERRRTTRAAIISATYETFAELGSADASMEAIARKAGITKGSIHYHFDNRAGLLAAVAVWLFTATEERIAAHFAAISERQTAKSYIRQLLLEQASPAGRVLFTIGDALEQQRGLMEADPYAYLCDKLNQLGVTGSVQVLAAAVMQMGRQLAYGEASGDDIDDMMAALAEGCRLE